MELLDPDKLKDDIFCFLIGDKTTHKKDEEKLSFSHAMGKVIAKYKEYRKLGIPILHKRPFGKLDFERENFELLSFYSGNIQYIEQIEEQHRIEEDDYKAINWQYCVVFPNPDYHSHIEYLNPNEVIELNDKCFLVRDLLMLTKIAGQYISKW